MQITWTTPLALTALHAAITVKDGVPLIDAPFASIAADVAAHFSREELGTLAAGAALGELLPEELWPLLAAIDRRSDELAHRVRPLREQWDARGPGLMRAIEQQSGPVGVERATVALVLPLAGGHGMALPGHDAVLFEAVLANPHPQLPEVVRLAWLLAQLGGADPLALVPAVLTAAEQVELLTADEPTRKAALAAWRVANPP